MINWPDRTPFRATRPDEFDTSALRKRIGLGGLHALVPTIIRLAELMKVVDPAKQYKLQIDSAEELEVQILAFRHLVHKKHFPLLGFEENDELMSGGRGQWEEGWTNQTYHPLLDIIPVSPMGFADHDVNPSDYGDLVALLYWLSTVDKEPTPVPSLEWEGQARREFNPAAVATILDGMELKPPLTYLPGLIRTVTKQTETFFLDACPLCGNFLGPEFSFSLENVIWFRDDWQIAKPIHVGNQELIRWASKSPERLAEISQILRKAEKIHQFYKDEQLPEWC